MAGSGASILGYGNTIPNSTVSSTYANKMGDTYAGGFGSNQTGAYGGLRGASNNVMAAKGQLGGRRKKNVYSLYKKKNMKRRISYKKKCKKRRHHSSKQRGGYAQYQSGVANTPSYSLGGILSAGNSSMANPPPVNVLSNNTNCASNYNQFDATQLKLW